MCEGIHDHSCHEEPSHKGHGCGFVGSRIERFMEPCLLLLLLEKPAHGYDLIERLKELGVKSDTPDPGMVYRTLRRLECEGMVRSEWETSGTGPARRLYEVTPEGKELLQAWVEVIKENISTLKAFLVRYEALK